MRWTFDVKNAEAQLQHLNAERTSTRQTHEADAGLDCSSDGHASNGAYLTRPS